MAENTLNFHHLRYFWAVAKDGNLTRTAARLGVSQSALSSQIRTLEDQLQQPLFHRRGRRLELTEAGHLALGYADQIFPAGDQLLATLGEGREQTSELRLGAVATLSRNFQNSFVEPLLRSTDTRLRMISGSFEELLRELAGHRLDLVLSNRPAQGAASEERVFANRQLARQAVSLIGSPRDRPFVFPTDLPTVPLLLPSTRSDVRVAFDAICEQLELRVQVIAEVDDMAMMRLIARDSIATALLPSVVVRDELKSGLLEEYCVVPGLHENFYAITVERQFPHPLLQRLLDRSGGDLL